MIRTAARDAMMKAIKVALKQQLWTETVARPTSGRCVVTESLTDNPDVEID
jgi:hypothetical protein